MRAEVLLAAIQDNKEWMKRFSRREYFQAFKDYTAAYAAQYLAEVRAAGSEEGLKAMAEEILDLLAAGWAKKWFWNRGEAKSIDKQMLLCYVTPMLLGLEDEDCRRFAEILQQAWLARWPKDGYQLATYKELRKGFRNIIMGLEFKDDLRELEEAQEEAEKNAKKNEK